MQTTIIIAITNVLNIYKITNQWMLLPNTLHTPVTKNRLNQKLVQTTNRWLSITNPEYKTRNPNNKSHKTFF